MKWKLLIVDDEPINLEFFDVMLSKLGFEVEKAVDGEDALEKVVEFVPDLIILDNVMPKVPGWEVTRRLKKTEEYKEYRHIPIIIFSALDGVDNKIEAIAEGAEDYITKPFSFREVLARIRGVLKRRELVLQIDRREKRIEVIESLNNMLLSFYNQVIKTPLKDLVDAAKKAGSSGAETANVCNLLKSQGEEILGYLDALDEKTSRLLSRKTNLKEGDLTPEELEKQFTELFQKLQNFEEEKEDESDKEGKEPN
jgi:DNA-binding response OmpR family regulator